MAEPADKKPIMDVAKPGKTAAPATSRPVIINHGAMVKDPMVNEAEEAATDLPTKNETPAVSPAPKKVITPPEETAPAEEKAEEEKDTKDTAPKEAEPDKKEETPKPAETEVPADAKKEPESTETSDQASDDAVVDAVVDQVADKKEQERLAEEEQKRKKLVDKLTAEKKYFVPLAVARHQRNNKIGLVFLVIVVLLIVGAVLAVDAGLVGETITLPFDLIKR